MDKKPDDKKVIEAAKLACVHEMILKLPAPNNVSGNTSFACESLVYSGLFGSSNNELY